MDERDTSRPFSTLSPLFHTRTGAIKSALVFGQVKAPAEPLDATGGVQNTLLSREEWMAF